MTTVNILVHGFNVSDPKESIGTLEEFVPDWYSYNYGWAGLVTVLRHNKDFAKDLKDIIAYHRMHGADTINVIAHSNGCAVAVEAARQGAIIDKLVAISPALKVNLRFPNNIKSVTVFYTPHDLPTRAARFLDWIPFIQLMVPNAWGAMGAKGPKYNIEELGTSYQDIRVTKSRQVEVKGHSDWFKPKNLKWFAPLLVRILNLDKK